MSLCHEKKPNIPLIDYYTVLFGLFVTGLLTRGALFDTKSVTNAILVIKVQI